MSTAKAPAAPSGRICEKNQSRQSYEPLNCMEEYKPNITTDFCLC